MSIVIKKIRGREYAYLSVREGSKVKHTYLGPNSSPKVARMIAEKQAASSVPEEFRYLFWDTNPDTIQLRKHASYVIERVLEFGDLDALSWLQKIYPTQRIIDVLLTSRAITAKSRGFWTIWFGVHDAS